MIVLWLVGRILGWFLIMSLALLFDNKKTAKSMIFVSIFALIICSILEIPGALNGRLISLPLVMGLFVKNLLSNIIPLSICVTTILYSRVYTKKWYTKTLPWFVGCLYGFVFVVTFPLIIREQVNLYKESKQMINIGSQLNMMIKQQNEIQNKYFDLCESIITREYPKLVPNERTKICVCFSEKMAQIVYNSNEVEFEKYQLVDTYKIKVWNRELEYCYKKLKY